MLKKLTIQNYALIDRIEIEFDRGLHILTGETGAGKSIILGALGLVMGERADTKTLFDPEQNCLVEAIFDLRAYELGPLLEENDIDPAEELIIRRVISTNGKSRAFINDLPTGLKTLQDITVPLVQIHNQFDNLDLAHPAYQLKMIDALAGNGPLLAKYSHAYTEWQRARKELRQLQQEVEEFAREKDFLRFQYEELSAIDLESALAEDIESQLELMENAEAISQALKMVFFELNESETAVTSALTRLARQLEQTGGHTQLVSGLSERIHELNEQLEQLGNECFTKSESIEYDPERIAELQSRLDAINKLLHKHQLREVSELQQLKSDFEQRLSRELEVENQMEELTRQIARFSACLAQMSKELTERRQAGAERFTKMAEKQLRELAMPHARLEGRFEALSEPGPNGTDSFELLFSANKGTQPQGIRHVASGGELSRLSLSLKSILAGHMSLPTLIFDEIEAGISGDIALKMGNILKTLSKNHQIINITHSAQIASRGDSHFFVYKSHEKDRSVTRIRALSADEKIHEIAKMLSGDPPTPTALKNANELIQLN